MKKTLSILSVVLGLLVLFFACDSSTPSIPSAPSVKDQTVEPVESVTASNLKDSGADTFLNLENKEDLGTFLQTFEDDAKLRKLFGDSENEGTLSEMLESDEVFGDIKKFVESIM